MPEWVDTARYWVAVLVVVAMPPAVLYWFTLHPFAAFWRRLGAIPSFAVLFSLMAGEIVALFVVRERVVGRDLGGHLVLIVLGALCYLVANVLERWVRRSLRTSVLIGVPELSRDRPGVLITDGAFAYSRNPRYLVILIATFGFALVANYSGAWLVTAFTFVAIWCIVRLEESELHGRFGEQYADYCRKVPRFFPRFAARSSRT